MVTILSLCFSSALLSTYFKFKPVKFMNSIKDVLDNPGIGVAGTYSALQLNNSILSEQDHKNLMTRIENYEEKMYALDSGYVNTNFMTTEILQDVMVGKAVLLVNSHLRTRMQDSFVEFPLEIGEDSYIMTYITYQVTKNYTFASEITRA